MQNRIIIERNEDKFHELGSSATFFLKKSFSSHEHMASKKINYIRDDGILSCQWLIITTKRLCIIDHQLVLKNMVLLHAVHRENEAAWHLTIRMQLIKEMES